MRLHVEYVWMPLLIMCSSRAVMSSHVERVQSVVKLAHCVEVPSTSPGMCLYQLWLTCQVFIIKDATESNIRLGHDDPCGRTAININLGACMSVIMFIINDISKLPILSYLFIFV